MAGAEMCLRRCVLICAVLMIFVLAGCKGFFVDPILNSITVTPKTPSIAVGGTQQMTATGNYDDGSTKALSGSSVTWTSSDLAAATVSDTGLVTGAAPGDSDITATSGTVSNSTAVKVTLPVVSMTIAPTSASIATTGTKQFTATGTLSDGTTADVTTQVTWSSSDTTVATIGNTSGLASGVKAGTTSISCSITVGSNKVTSSNQPVLTVQ